MAGAHSSDEIWGDYWADAPADSCVALLPEAARQNIEAEWSSAFAALNKGDSVLDIATGKGAVLMLAAITVKNPGNMKLLGVDRAPTPAIAPDNAQAAQYEIHGDIDAAALPFPTRAFTLVTSQFGLEYADFDEALSEALRVCDQRLLLLMHAAEGAVVKQNAAEADQIFWMLDGLHLFEKLQDSFKTFSDKIGTEIDATLTLVRKRIDETENPRLLAAIYQGCTQLKDIAKHQSSDGAVHATREMEARMRNHAARMRELASAARTAEDCTRAVRTVENNGFSKCSLHNALAPGSGELVGRWLDAAR